MKATLRWGLGNRSVSGQHLHKFGMNQNAERIVPRSNVRNRPTERGSSHHLAIDFAEVPFNAVDAAIDIGARELPWLTDFPGKQQRQSVACNAQACKCGG